MANGTKPGRQGNAYQALSDYSALAQQISNILTTITDLKYREQVHAYSTIYANTTTYSLNADGTAGSVDSNPDSSHPMSGSYLSANDVNGFVGYVVNDLYNFLTGVVGPTTADRRPAIKGMLP